MEGFKKLLEGVENTLKTEGFARKGDAFHLLREGNLGIIDFQKSKDSTKAAVKFTINIGIQSTVLNVILNGGDAGKQISDCHWKKRVGFLLPQNADHWWIIQDNHTSTEKITSEIAAIVTAIVIPYLKDHLKDESLKLEWLKGYSEGITALQRYIYLTTLLKLHGDEILADIVKSFLSFSQGKAYESIAIEHLKKLDLYSK